MDARTSSPTTSTDPAATLQVGAGRSSAPMAARGGGATGVRKIVRGAIGIATVLVLWQVMAVAYDLQQILPPPLVGRAHHLQHADAELRAALALRPEHLRAPVVELRARDHGLYASRRRLRFRSGLLVGRFRAVREYVDPVIRSLYPIPGIAWIPLAILWFGLGNTAVMFVVFIAEFFPLYFNTEAGARNINPILVDAARCFGAKRLTLLRRVILPASIPYIITGMRIALGGAWRMIVAGEMLASQSGIGSVLMEVALPVPRHRPDDGDDPHQHRRLRHRAADRRHA